MTNDTEVPGKSGSVIRPVSCRVQAPAGESVLPNDIRDYPFRMKRRPIDSC